VARSFGRHVVFSDLNLVLAPGKTLGLIGPNGAGKTTLLRMVVGLLRPDGGQIRLNGQPPVDAISTCTVAYFAGEASLPPALRAGTWARLLGCPDLEDMANKPIRKLSRGTRQRLGLTVTLARPGAQLVILDEPWEGLDPDASRWLRGRIQALRSAGTATILSSHRMHDLAGLCDHYAFVVGKRLTRVAAAEIAPYRDVTGEDLFAWYDRLRQAE
jgi:ABC-2 type transport system ATP-binding protein